MIWYEWCQSDESPILRPTLPYRGNQLAALVWRRRCLDRLRCDAAIAALIDEGAVDQARSALI